MQSFSFEYDMSFCPLQKYALFSKNDVKIAKKRHE